jgi:hypothetical protein
MIGVFLCHRVLKRWIFFLQHWILKPGVNAMIFKIFSRKKLAETINVFDSNSFLCQKSIIIFQEKRHFFRRKSLKILGVEFDP